MQWIAIAPIREPLWLTKHTLPLKFTNGVSIDLLPDSYKTLYSRNEIGVLDSVDIQKAMHAFLFPYEATSIRDFVEPMQDNRSMLSVSIFTISLANLSIWISKPNGLIFGPIINLRLDSDTKTCNYSRIRHFIPHIDYMNEIVQDEDFKRACTIYSRLLNLDSQGTTWRAVYSLWTALREHDWATRFMQLWMGIEALFGPKDAREISFRVSQRIAFFLESDMEAAKILFQEIKKSYGWRSNIVHGLRFTKLTYDDQRKLSFFVENLISKILFKELNNPDFISNFESSSRESFLDNLAFQK